MGLKWMTAIIGFMVLMVFGYNLLVFELVDAFFKMPRLKKIYRIPVAIASTILVLSVTMLSGNSTFLAYITISVILFVEFTFFYRDKITSSLFCMLACVIHVMAVRSICVAMYAVMMQCTIYTVANTPSLIVSSTAITFLILNLVIMLVIKIVPAKGVRIINQHGEQHWFMIAWLSVFCIYMQINSKVFETPSNHPDLITNQIIAPAAILIGNYIILYFSFKMGDLLGYREMSEELQNAVEKERQYRISIEKGVYRVVEVNFSKCEVVSGFEDYKDSLGDSIYDYEKILAFMIQTSVYAEDSNEFIKYLSPSNAIKELEEGKTETSFDYRHLTGEENYVWMHVSIMLIKDSQNNDIKGFVQFKDIDVEKRQQLNLQYKAERDLLTGLYNKSTTESLITNELSSIDGIIKPGVLFIIDIDNFKMINDRLGHLYGDAVLSELSESLRKSFKNTDIVGRIGGDEFIVFAKSMQEESGIIKKANSICTAFLQTYANDKKEDYTVSSSIGIALFPKDGDNFEDLFKRADAALYVAKAQGKNRYAFYDETYETSYVSSRTEIDDHGLVQKSFKDNRIEYVFRLLYGTKYTKAAIESALELIAKNFGFSRANIFEFNEMSTHFNGVFEWCAVGIESVSANYIDMPIKSFEFVVSALEKSGGMFMAVPEDFPQNAQESYTSIGIKSLVHFSIKEQGKLIGVIAFQHCISDEFRLSNTEFEELRTICQVLSVFMAKQLSNERELRHHQAIEAVMDNMNSIAYVIDRADYTVYYENQNTISITGNSSIGRKCYKTYRGLEAPCDDCPLSHLSEENSRITLEMFTEKFNIYTKTSAALLTWSNDREAMLISSVDVSEYK